jgi:hypothetical protein
VEIEAYLEWLRELDPQDIVAELDLDSETLMNLLEEYVRERESNRSE